MRLGVHLPVAGKGASPSIILEVAAEAERVGLDSEWSWERLMRPTPIALGAGGPVMDAPEAFGIVHDPIETLAYVAAQTSRITLGTSSMHASKANHSRAQARDARPGSATVGSSSGSARARWSRNSRPLASQ